MPKTYFISDTHFGHANILKFEPEKRPFANVDEMNEYIIAQWNAIVRPEDTVWHLGDVYFGGKENLQLCKRLMGHKKLILGNHDKGDVQEYLDVGFESIHGMVKMKMHGTCAWLTHGPLNDNEFNHGCTINIHGHTHGRLVHNGNKLDDRYINVCVEYTGCKPVALEDILKHHKKVLESN